MKFLKEIELFRKPKKIEKKPHKKLQINEIY